MSRETLADVDTGEDFGWALGVLLRSYRERVTPALGDFPHGARGYQTLVEVMRARQPSQLALANRVGVDRTIMTYLIDDLEEAGLVERRPNPTDRRQRQIVATAEGVASLAALCRQVVAAEDALLGGLDAEERTLLRALLNKAACAIGDSRDGAELCEED